MSLLSSDFLTFLRFILGVALAALLVTVCILVGFGLAALHDVMWPPGHPLQCVQAHDEWHDGQVQVCDQYKVRS